MADKPTQRRFAVMGENLFRITSKLAQNQRLCRLLKYLDASPFREELPDVDGTELINNNIIIIPKIPETDVEERAFVIVVFERYLVNPDNADFKLSSIRFDVVCPFNEWIVNDDNLRPYLIMQEIDGMFNQCKMAGIGNLQFTSCEPLVLSPHLGGYTLHYQINEFN